MDGPHGYEWRGISAQGEALLDREVFLSLFEFGLVTLAGIAAENIYQSELPPEENPLVAISDLSEWEKAALQLLKTPERIDLVSRNLIRHLEEILSDAATWHVVENLATELLTSGTVTGDNLQRILDPLTPSSPS